MSVLLVVGGLAPPSFAIAKGPDCGPNAALRYWMAFALMENPAADSEVAKRMARIAEGQEPWDDSLAPILERNAEALATMHRGSRVGYCDWGFEHELLAAAPIAHVARARALARLNVVHGMRLLRQGRSADAVDAWLAGVRFSRDVAADGPWLGALVAGGALRVHFDALARAVEGATLDHALLQKVRREVAALAEDGFDWSVAARHESRLITATARRLEGEGDPIGVLEKDYGLNIGARTPEERARFLGLTTIQLSDPAAVQGVFRRVRELNEDLGPALVEAFRMPYQRSSDAIRDLDARVAKDRTLSSLWLSPRRANDARGAVVKARTALLGLLGPAEEGGRPEVR